MATKAITKATTKKPAARSTGPKTAAAEKSAAATKRTAEKKAEEAAPKPEPKPKQEAVSLIEPKEKKVRPAKAAESKSFKVLPPISGILKREDPEPKPEPVPEKAPDPEPAPAPVEEVVEEVPEEKIIHLKPPIIVKELAAQMGLKPFQLISDLMAMNIFAAINQTIEPDIATTICAKHGFVFERDKRKTGEGVHKVEEVIAEPEAPVEIEEDELKLRAPIITFMGHVDHGKTSLMDAIRETRVTAGEAGGITQHIGAYRVEKKGHAVTFLDTPGHAAFTAMRARGANITDIVVLVVAADDGLMPQTLEAINHAKAAKVNIVVAINKIDLASANVDKVKGQLQEQGLTPEDWGGETICCQVSATKGTGIPELLDMLQLQAEVLELRSSPSQAARGTVIEAQVEPGRGPTATVIVRMGTLEVGDAFICGNYSGKVKLLTDDMGKPMKKAGPSTPVKVLGFAGIPNAGDDFVVMDSERQAKALSEERLDALRRQKLSTPRRVTLENLFDSLADDKRKSLEIVLKCDVQGSLEALTGALGEIDSKKIDLKIIHSGIGPISESDVLLATASDAVIVGFNVKVENSAANAARREGVEIKLYSIIYELIDQIKEAMAGLLDPETREAVIGHASVKKVFETSKGSVAGCQVSDGRISRNARARVLRGRQPIYDGGITTLKRFKDDVKEVRTGLECGIKLGDFGEYEEGDVIECYTLEKVAQKL